MRDLWDFIKSCFPRKHKSGEYCFHYRVLVNKDLYAVGGIAARNADEAADKLMSGRNKEARLIRLSVGVCLDEVQDPDGVLRWANTVPKWFRSRSSAE